MTDAAQHAGEHQAASAEAAALVAVIGPPGAGKTSDGRFNIGVGPALLDNFLGTAHQLHRLADVAAVTGRRIAILELPTDGSTAAVRVAARRICLACSSNRDAPALASATRNFMP